MLLCFLFLGSSCLILVLGLSYLTLNILAFSPDMWCVSLTQSLFDARCFQLCCLKKENKIKVKKPKERGFLQRQLFLTLSLSLWIVLRDWYSRCSISIFKRSLIITGVLLAKNSEDLETIVGKEIWPVGLDGQEKKWHSKGDPYSHIYLVAVLFYFNISYILFW